MNKKIPLEGENSRKWLQSWHIIRAHWGTTRVATPWNPAIMPCKNPNSDTVTPENCSRLAKRRWGSERHGGPQGYGPLWRRGDGGKDWQEQGRQALAKWGCKRQIPHSAHWVSEAGSKQPAEPRHRTQNPATSICAGADNCYGICQTDLGPLGLHCAAGPRDLLAASWTALQDFTALHFRQLKCFRLELLQYDRILLFLSWNVIMVNIHNIFRGNPGVVPNYDACFIDFDFVPRGYSVFLASSTVPASANQNRRWAIRTHPVRGLQRWAGAEHQPGFVLQHIWKGNKKEKALSSEFSSLPFPLKPWPCPWVGAPPEKGEKYIPGRQERPATPVAIQAPPSAGLGRPPSHWIPKRETQ